jgi:HPt (histidine-containing phosphotransfer) domain-containing protein
MELEPGLGHGGRMKSQADEPQAHVLDRHVFEELLATLGNDSVRVRNVYRKFVDSTAARLDEVRNQSVTDSAATFHALKGSASMVGANRLAALAAHLQDAAPRLDKETKVSAIDELEKELTAFGQALSVLMDCATPDR